MTYAVKNWDRFQHYKERHPPWIKLYHSLLDDDGFAELDHFSQLLYFKLLMAASRKDNRIPADASWMATELSLPRRRVQGSVKILLAAGFITTTSASTAASKTASTRDSESASPSRAPAYSREVETEAEIDLSQEQPNPTPPVARPPTKNGLGVGEINGDHYGPEPLAETVDQIIAGLRGQAA